MFLLTISRCACLTPTEINEQRHKRELIFYTCKNKTFGRTSLAEQTPDESQNIKTNYASFNSESVFLINFFMWHLIKVAVIIIIKKKKVYQNRPTPPWCSVALVIELK